MFSSGASNGQPGTGTEQPGQRPNADRVFGDVFEDVCSLFPFLSPFPPFLPYFSLLFLSLPTVEGMHNDSSPFFFDPT